MSTPFADFVEKFFAPLIEQAHEARDGSGNGPAAGFIAAHCGFRQAEEDGELVHREVMLDTDGVEVGWFHTVSVDNAVANVNSNLVLPVK